MVVLSACAIASKNLCIFNENLTFSCDSVITLNNWYQCVSSSGSDSVAEAGSAAGHRSLGLGFDFRGVAR